MTTGPWPLALAGWEDLSTWGYDDRVGTLYAQLTRNGGHDDSGPEIWVTHRAIRSSTAPAILAEHRASAAHAPCPRCGQRSHDAVDAQGASASFRIT